MSVPEKCAECSAILRELAESWRTDTEQMRASSADPVELRNEWLFSDDYQMRELYQKHYPKLMVARRKKTEHEILTGHQIILNGWRGAR